ncbi:transporter substrate-binding domain-containing protein [Rhodoferax saidenbachensis]|uniref:Polar amino acid transport system substrate-binding protein n=1 Tax=Rhodoferax saidenbachensis TaxID=1484693 RepID=A0ABU1ZSC5_9BURK|nr:transporter substrate-binding domain-containing protein [Rhodoferax saidenbachensis]MDR7308298.1 polar amino acid transport system substrate-binding protein [Rhodoferax saidenbachensis]
MGAIRFFSQSAIRTIKRLVLPWLWRGLWLTCLAPMGISAAHAQTLVLAAADSVPTAYVENGKQVGLLVDVVNEVFKRTGYSVEIAIMPWARCLAEVKAGRIDGIFSVYQTRERQEFLTYAEEVLITQVQAFFVRKDSAITFDGDLNKLSELRIGIINQTSYGPRLDSALEKGVFKKVDVANNVSASIKKLLVDRVDVVPSYRHVALDSARTLGLAGSIKELSPAIAAIPSYLAFTNKKDYAKVISAYNLALRSMKKDGTYDAIFNKYLAGPDVRKTNPDLP